MNLSLGDSARRRIPAWAVALRLCGVAVETIARLVARPIADVERLLASHGTTDMGGRYRIGEATRKALELPAYIPDVSPTVGNFVNIKVPVRFLQDVAAE